MLKAEQTDLLITEGGASLGKGPARALPAVPHQVKQDQAEDQESQTCSCSFYKENLVRKLKAQSERY